MTRRGARVLFAGVGALVLLAVVAVLLAPLLVDADSFRPHVEERLSEALGRPVRLGTLAFSLLRGPSVVVPGIEIGEPTGAAEGEAPTFRADRTRVSLALLPLLRRTPVVRSLSLDGGMVRHRGRTLLGDVRLRARIGTEPDGSPRASVRIRAVAEGLPDRPRGDLSGNLVLVEGRVLIREIILKLGGATIEGTGEAVGIRSSTPRISLEGNAEVGATRLAGTVQAGLVEGRPDLSFRISSPLLDLDELSAMLAEALETPRAARRPAPSVIAPAAIAMPAAAMTPGRSRLLTTATARGTIDADRGRFAGFDVRALRARVTYAGGKLRFPEADFGLCGGTHKGRFEVFVLDEDLPFELRDEIEGVDLAALMAASDRELGGTLSGSAGLRLDLTGRAPGGLLDSRSVSGSARLEVRDGRLAGVGLLRRIAAILEMAGGAGLGSDETPFERLAGTFSIEEGAARTNDLEFRSADLDLEGGGSVGLDGALDLDVLVTFSPEVSEAMVRKTKRLAFRRNSEGRLTVPLLIRGDLASPQVQLDLERVLEEGLGRVLREEGKKRLLRGLLGGD